MNKLKDKQDDKLRVLNKELYDIGLGEDILKAKKKVVEIDIANRKAEVEAQELRAIVIQLSQQPKMKQALKSNDKEIRISTQKLLEAQQLDNLEAQNMSEENKNIERKELQEIVVENV